MLFSPPFSVLISTYKNDSPEFLHTSLGSLFEQTLRPAEVVLVVDGPISRELQAIIDDFKKKYPDVLQVYPLESNIGLGPALNYGLKKCRNEYVARMDSDDISFPERFAKQIGHLANNPSIDVLGANVEEFSKIPGDLRRINSAPNQNNVYSYSRWRNPMNHPSIVFKKSAVLAANSYEDVPFFEDYYLWINLLKKGYKIDNLPEVLLYFRNDEETISRRLGFSYIKHELNFLRLAYRNRYLELPYIIAALMIRIPLRLLPRKLLSTFYHYFLRKKI